MGISEILKERILVLDGAMGTMIQSYHLTEEDFRGERFKNVPGLMKGNNDILCLTRPDVVKDIHRRYLEAGADMIETNTFSSQTISMADYHVEKDCRDIVLAGCRLAREMADEFTQQNPSKPRFVLGSVGPTNKTCSMSPDVSNPAFRAVTFKQMVEAYTEQMDAMIEGGVDAFLIETIFDTLNAKAAVFAAQEAMQKRGVELPIMLSVTVSDKSGRTLSGQTLEAFLASMQHANVLSVGLNCSFGAHDMLPFLRILAQKAPYYISVYPNAGLPNSMGLYDQTPEMMAHEMQTFLNEGLVNIVGGCCGTTDQHIALLAKLTEDATPHVVAEPSPYMQLSGLEMLEVSPQLNFVNIGERCNVAGSRKFLRLIKEGAYDEALAIARKQVNDGAQVIDINMDDGLLDAEKEMTTFLNLIASEPEIARVPIMIDSSKWEVIIAGLQCVQGKCIVNSISLKEGEERFLTHAAEVKRYGAAVVVMAFDEKGQADTYERKIEVCQRAYRLLTEQVGMQPQDIIFDPNVLAIATGMEEHDKYALDFIRATEWIHQNLPGAHVSGGVSNLSFSFRGNNYIREAMHAVFLYHTIAKGMDMAIVNPSASVMYSDLPDPVLKTVEDVILNTHPDAAERLIELANEIKAQNEQSQNGSANEQTAEQWRSLPVDDRLCHALIKGDATYMNDDLTEALNTYPHAVDVIEGPLMKGMNQVGDLFGQGKMFLPQVVKTARTMKKAVAFLQPFIEAEKQGGNTKAGTVVIATVKGDVHDIGKNIVGVILACNNYEVKDLGVMVPAEEIVECAIREHADAVGLSGLITPSLDEMQTVVKELKNAELNIPVLIGGATTSELHTALKIAPLYDGAVLWMKDAAQDVIALSNLMDDERKASYMDNVTKRYEQLVANYTNKNNENVVSIQEAQNKKLNLF